MKNKIIIIASAAFVALAGCTKVESFALREQSDNQICFTTYTGRAMTKGTNPDFQQSFVVEAFVNGNPSDLYFYPTKFRYSGGRYIGDTTRYWTTTGEHFDFYASSPLKYTNISYSDVYFNTVDSTFSITKTNGKTDILAARLVDQEKTTSVALEFGHTLTRVMFSAVGADTTKSYKVSQIMLKANSSAKYNYGDTATWTLSTDPYDYSFVRTPKTIPTGTLTPQAVGDTLFLIPVQASSVKALVWYSVYSGSYLIDTTVDPVEIDLPVQNVWDINSSVTYKMVLDISSSVEPISFTAAISGWNEENVVLPVPRYVDENGVDRGPGIWVADNYWAPVNCGYDPVNYPYGKLYQWGRKVGGGYNTGTAPYDTELAQTSVSSTWPDGGYTNNPADDKFYNSSDSYPDWYTNTSNHFTEWPMTDPSGTTGIGNPCPEGWRVPRLSELTDLTRNYSSSTSKDGLNGLYFSGFNTYSSTVPSVFLPFGGYRQYDGVALSRTVWGYYWTSTGCHDYGNLPWCTYFAVKPFFPQYSTCNGYSVRCVAE